MEVSMWLVGESVSGPTEESDLVQIDSDTKYATYVLCNAMAAKLLGKRRHKDANGLVLPMPTVGKKYRLTVSTTARRGKAWHPFNVRLEYDEDHEAVFSLEYRSTGQWHALYPALSELGIGLFFVEMINVYLDKSQADCHSKQTWKAWVKLEEFYEE